MFSNGMTGCTISGQKNNASSQVMKPSTAIPIGRPSKGPACTKPSERRKLRPFRKHPGCGSRSNPENCKRRSEPYRCHRRQDSGAVRGLLTHIQKHLAFVDDGGGRTRDRTLDLSRVKGTLSR